MNTFMSVLELVEDMMDLGLFFWKWMMEIKQTEGCFRVAELCRSVYFVTAGIKRQKLIVPHQ